MISIETATFTTSVVLVQQFIFDRQEFGASSASAHALNIIALVTTTERVCCLEMRRFVIEIGKGGLGCRDSV